MKQVQMPQLGELYMVLHDDGRKRLAKLMIVQDVSHRRLAMAAGWRSHSYVSRLLRGEAKTLDTEPALRIAAFLGVGVDDLFLTRVAKNSGSTDSRAGKGNAA
ncbi:helix-turn-helix DNA binding domain protein [Gordonia phage Budski]|nr:helix-turn-helix DNA binding domain protein [Gordonia phage Budski]